MTGVAFFFVGAVLFVTAMQMLGKADAKGVSVLHAILSGLLVVIVAFTLITAKGAADYFFAFLLLLFVFTYVPERHILVWPDAIPRMVLPGSSSDDDSCCPNLAGT
jgi:hypothetical protein